MAKKQFLFYFILFAGFFLLIFKDSFVWLFLSWLYNPYLNYGFLVPLVSSFLVYKKRKSLFKQVRGRNFGLVLIAFSLLFFMVNSYALKIVSFLFLLFGTIIYFLGFDTFGKIRFPLFYLFFMVPAPDFVLEAVGFRLRQIALLVSIFLASPFLGLSLLEDMDILINNEVKLGVGLPCSGLESFLAFTVIGVLFAYFYEKGTKRRLALVLLCPFFSVLFNIARLVFLFFVASVFGGSIAFDIFHVSSGIILTLVFFACLAFYYRRKR